MTIAVSGGGRAKSWRRRATRCEVWGGRFPLHWGCGVGTGCTVGEEASEGSQEIWLRLSFALSVNKITHECVNGRRPNMLGLGNGWPSRSDWMLVALTYMFLFPVLHCDVWYTNQRPSFAEKCFLAPLLYTRSLKALVDMSYKQAYKVFFYNSINFSSNSSLQNSICRQTRQNTSYVTSWPTNWVNWVTTFRTDRWQLFTLWTCRQLHVELSWVASASL